MWSINLQPIANIILWRKDSLINSIGKIGQTHAKE